jgi:DNA integrity scanning protein DisA with diadenylate cyclase activity
MFESILCQVTDHDPDILDSLIGLAVEIAREGREGRRVGTLFTLGDENVLARIRKRVFLVERRVGFAAVELGRGA